MAEPESWIKLNRNILTWGWYLDINTTKLFIHLLLKANIKENVFLGVPVKRGQLATSYPHLSKESGLSVRNVRTALNHLKSTGEVTATTYPKFSLITVVNYEKYQNFQENLYKFEEIENRGDRQADSQVTGDRQAIDNNQRMKEYKNIASLGHVLEFCDRSGVPFDFGKSFFVRYNGSGWTDANGQPVRNWKKLLLKAWQGERVDHSPELNNIPDHRYSFSPDDCIEYPPGSGEFIDRNEWEAHHARG